MRILDSIFKITQTIAYEKYIFMCRKQWNNETLERFHADSVELASLADYGDREDEWFRYMFTAHMSNEKIAEELLAETRSPQDAYEYAIRREKGIEHSK